MGGRGVTDWLRQKRGRNNTTKFEKRNRVRFMKKSWGYYHSAKISHKKRIKKTYILNSFKVLRKRLETCNQIYIHKNIMISGICKALICSMLHLQINKENLPGQT